MDKNKVVIRNITEGKHNVRLALHPFCFQGSHTMRGRGRYKDGTAEWQQRMSDDLWDTIPGMRSLDYRNGGLTVEHSGAFDDGEVLELVMQTVRPFLERELEMSAIDF